jgi:hypothetical protein
VIAFACPRSGANQQVIDTMPWQKLPCSQCGQRLQVPPQAPVEQGPTMHRAPVRPSARPAAVANPIE